NMLEEALILVRAEAAANQVLIDLDASNDLPAVHGDRTQLEQVVLNLVRNAMESIAGALKLTDASGSPRIVSTRPHMSRSVCRTTVAGSTANWRRGYPSLSQHRKRLASASACQFVCRLSNRMAGASGSTPGRRAQPSSDFRSRSLNRK